MEMLNISLVGGVGKAFLVVSLEIRIIKRLKIVHTFPSNIFTICLKEIFLKTFINKCSSEHKLCLKNKIGAIPKCPIKIFGFYILIIAYIVFTMCLSLLHIFLITSIIPSAAL